MKLALIALGVLLAAPAIAGGHKNPRQSAYSTHVSGYTKSNGTRVAPANRSRADRSKANNYSTKGSMNPYTGKSGTRNAYGH